MPDDLIPDGPGGLPKPVLIAGGVALLAFGYMYWKNKQNANAANSNTATPYGAPISGSGVIEPIVLNNTPPPTTTTSTGTTTNTPRYCGVPTLAYANQIAAQGGNLYYNPSPGVFVKVPNIAKSGLPKGTLLYTDCGSTNSSSGTSTTKASSISAPAASPVKAAIPAATTSVPRAAA